MKKRLQGLIAGTLIGSTVTGGAVFATTGTKTIEVLYNNIKVYKDNVLCELKDANGTVVEPFIYNGTTYMPVRGTANLADMQVTWDGNTKSVYLWDKQVPTGTYLMEVCPPYEKSSHCDTYLQSEGESFQMSGGKYSNGFSFKNDEQFVMFNLNSRYSTINCTVGHIDGSDMQDQTISFIVDGKLVKEITVEAEALPKTISIPVSYGLQLKIINGDDWCSSRVGIGNIIVE